MIYSIYETFCCFDEKGVILNIFFVQVSQGYGRGLRELVKVFLNLITDQSHSCCQCYNLQEPELPCGQCYHVINVTKNIAIQVQQSPPRQPQSLN